MFLPKLLFWGVRRNLFSPIKLLYRLFLLFFDLDYLLYMSDLTEALDRILTWLRANNSVAASGFQPGILSEEIDDNLNKLPFFVSREVSELYRWRNGDESYSSAFGYLWLLNLETACEFSEFVNDASLREMRSEDEPQYLLPLFDFDGEYFAVQGSEVQTDKAPIFHVGTSYDLKFAFTNLTGMMQAIAECYESGIYRVDENGLEVVDPVRFGEIRRKHNPGTAERIYADGW
jgi:hypothetical protein